MTDAWLNSYVRAFAPACPMCHAALAADQPTCPKCRTEMRLGLKVREVYLAAWGVTLGGSLVLAGFGLFLSFIVLRRGMPPSAPGPSRYVVLSICVLGIVMAGAAFVLLATRRSFCRLPRFIQWLTAIMSVGLAAASTVAFALAIR